MNDTTANPLFLRRARKINTIAEAVDGAVRHLQRGDFQRQAAAAFDGGFGPEPFVTFRITIRRDPKQPGAFSYRCNTYVCHDIGEGVAFYGLKP